jgi:hypothetical protein
MTRNNTTAQPETDFPKRIGNPARSALIAAGYTHLEQLTAVNEADLIELHGMGPKALAILRQTLADQGLSFADAQPDSDLPPAIGERAIQALTAAGYTRLEQLTQTSQEALLKLDGVGPKAVNIIHHTLAIQGLSFAAN